MRRKKPEVVIAPVCDYCGTRSETFVVTANHSTFCRVQTPGFPAEKDCMEDYLRSKRNAKSLRKNEKEKEQRRLQSNSKEQLQKRQKEKEKIIKKFDDYLFQLKQKQRRRNASK